jgi:hypothetical protein
MVARVMMCFCWVMDILERFLCVEDALGLCNRYLLEVHPLFLCMF